MEKGHSKGNVSLCTANHIWCGTLEMLLLEQNLQPSFGMKLKPRMEEKLKILATVQHF